MRENVFYKSVRNSHVPEAFCYALHVKIVHAPRACVLVGAWTLGDGRWTGAGAGAGLSGRWTLGGAVGALHRFVLVAGLK